MRFGYTGDNGDGTFSPGVFIATPQVLSSVTLYCQEWTELKCLPCPNLSRVNSLKDFSLMVVSECVCPCHCFCVGQVMSSHQMSSKVKSMTVMIFKEATEG